MADDKYKSKNYNEKKRSDMYDNAAIGGSSKTYGSDAAGSVKTDKRIKRTKHSIQQALLKLMHEKPIEKITVSELAAEAGVNRKTFYNHYESVHDVRKELDKSFIDLIISTICDTEGLTSDFKTFMKEFIGRIVDIIADEPASARFLFTSGELSYLAEQIKKPLRLRLIQAAEHEQIKASSVLFYIEYIGNGALAVLKTWVTNEFLVPSDEIKEILIDLITSTIPEKYQLVTPALEYSASNLTSIIEVP